MLAVLFASDDPGASAPPLAIAARFGSASSGGTDEGIATLRSAAGGVELLDSARARASRVERTAIDRINSMSLGAVSEGAYVPRARYLEEIPSRWRFEGEECLACRYLTFPRRGRCRHCARTDKMQPHAFPLDGVKVVSATEIGKGGQPTEFDLWVEAMGPYGVLLVELAPGVRATVQTSGAPIGEFPIGRPVSTRLRRLYPMEGEWRYGRKAVPVPR
ncbi:MAG: Zn-ribbon domain-containing OB-fold protein [Thermoplasmata archaeon]